jgi:hypothetical protein
LRALNPEAVWNALSQFNLQEPERAE